MKKVRRKNRGFALLMVIAVLGLTAVLGFAMMSGTELQVQTGQNALNAAAADSLAESGMNLAAYYLQYPSAAPSLNSFGFWAGATGFSFGSSVPGTVDIVVSSPSTNVYSITSTGKSGATSSSTTQRKIIGQLAVNPGLQFKYGAMFSQDVSLPSMVQIVGGVQCNGAFTNWGNISGTVYSNSIQNKGVYTATWSLLTSANKQTVTSTAHVKDYRTYAYQGQTYTATTLGSGTIAANTTLGTSATNPAGIYYYSGNLTMAGSVAINGTLIVDNGSFTVNGTGSTITAVSGYPALVVKSSDLIFKGLITANRTFNVNGVTWVGGSIKSSGVFLSGAMNLNGAVVFGNGGSVDSGFTPLATVKITYDSTKTYAPDMDTSVASPGVKFTSWQQ